ncbi:hypothetical protein DCS32_06040 [Dokdonia sp. Dokd-P16]|uniref:hypothetical protein n=1 Tax=Dokdonia sp. Dokd-P16 TaxID=2173169 RepID=UPI000D549C8B|nr:hypothetical protein [Dokdonia sp. Dokd-P16]AWH73732.1 hypothetical protein DCS32_06040 [Dokdonia sp. Dokd-P16]
MSDHYNQSGNQQEMDLSDIFSLVGRLFKNVVYSFFRIVDYVIKMWWAFLLLIIAGIAIGFVLKDEPSYEANLLLKTNFTSQAYVYTAIEQFNNNLEEDDEDFITSLGKSPENFSIKKVNVEPVVEVIDLVNYIGENDGALGEMTREFKLKDDRELFATDRFLSKFKFHKLKFTFDSDKNLEDIESFLSFINDNSYAKELKKEGLKNHKIYLESQEQSIAQINELINSFSKDNNKLEPKDGGGFYFNNQSNNLASLFHTKSNLVEDLEIEKNDFVSYSDLAVIVSDIQVSKKSSITDNLIVIFPLGLVIIFLIFSGIVSVYKSYRRETAVLKG